MVAAADAEAARHLAAARDRDLADLGVKVDADRTVINALGQQLNGRIDRLEGKVDAVFAGVDEQFEAVGQGFLAVRGQLDSAAGQRTVVDMLTRLIADPPNDRTPRPTPANPTCRSGTRHGSGVAD